MCSPQGGALLWIEASQELVEDVVRALWVCYGDHTRPLQQVG